ncbi:unnamed protein product [Bursaphelenchus okinawaensis]|uniref:Alpha-MPP n=1 Tax=Bursaphelenchus okinawaensis TaxID=465554 RepID=A0A811LQ74_9BILA|nr:unnamed protein product [Bursaphelenchus okinawaensis]CAG9126976.1 unnamed protein product [Bursaphelenchus okinawaensis]
MLKAKHLPILLLRTNVKSCKRFTSSKVDYNTISLSEPLPGFEKVTYSKENTVKLFDTKITQLQNGLTIATEEATGEYCTVGVAVNAGSRYQTYYPWGVSHFVEKLGFGSSQNYPDRAETFNILDSCGAIIDCQSTKDTTIYAASCLRETASKMTKIIADTVMRPIVDPLEVNETAYVVKFEREAFLRKPEPEEMLIDWVHCAGFKSNTLGIPKYCEKENPGITREDVLSYMSQYYSPDRMVLAGVGVDHDLLVALGKKYFNTDSTTWAQFPELVHKDLPSIDHSQAQFTGGIFQWEKDLSKIGLGIADFPNLAHMMFGFESVATSHSDFVAFCVLQSLLGGGGSFSAGGPGKGMFSRLYADVMFRYHWLYNVTSFNFSYMDSGIFAVRASAPPDKLTETCGVILNEFFRLAHTDVVEAELDRAKIQLKSQLMMNLELRPVMFEDMVRQVLNHGERKNPHVYLEEIDKVTAKDIRRVSERMLASKPAIVAYGDLKKLPSYEKIDRTVAKRSLSLLQ